MKNIKIYNKILISILFIICLFLFKNVSKVNAASYIWPVGGDNYEETYIEYKYGQRYYNSDLYNQKYNYGTLEQYYRNQTAENHFGVDIVGIKGHTYNVVSVANGTVIATSADRKYNAGLNFADRNLRRSPQGSLDGGGYGNYVVIQDSSNGKCFLYGHLKAGTVTVKKGSTVKAGQKIGIMGSSGDSGHMHLHFEVRKNYNSALLYGGLWLANTTGYNVETENPENYIGSKPEAKKPAIIPAKRERITFMRYSKYRQINIYFDKPVIVKEAPVVTIRVGNETKTAEYLKISDDGKKLAYGIKYDEFDIFTSGIMYVDCSGKVIDKTSGNIEVACNFKDVTIGELNAYKIDNTYKKFVDGQKGDVDGDGYIDATDATLVMRVCTLLNSGDDSVVDQELIKRADIDGDGVVNMSDASLVLSYYTHLSSTTNAITINDEKRIIKCDLNNDTEVDVKDYNELKSAIDNQIYDDKFDLNEDNKLDNNDIDFLRNTVLKLGHREI